MYSSGDVVSYAAQGVCRIRGIEMREIAGQKRDYYVLCPIRDEHSTVYVPTDSERLLANMRPVLTKDEINDLIDTLKSGENEWICDESERREIFSQAVRSGDRVQLIKLIDMLYLHQLGLKAQKKHIHVSDERCLREAERLLHDEVAFVLGIPVEKVPQYIRKCLGRA